MLLLAAALSALRIRAYYPAACEDICFSIKGSITERVLCSFDTALCFNGVTGFDRRTEFYIIKSCING